MKHIVIVFITTFFSTFLFGQTCESRYRISFTDKQHSPFSITKPEAFLSERAITRRKTQNIKIKENDLPVNQHYIDSVTAYGAQVRTVSKWFNSITVFVPDSCENLLKNIQKLPFVSECVRVAPQSKTTVDSVTLSTIKQSNNLDFDDITETSTQDFYGNSYHQTAITNAQNLHMQGFMGQGKMIAILDAGFLLVDSIEAFQRAWDEKRILAYKDFSGSNSNIFREGSHGTAVFSLIGGFVPGHLIGTAPRADYLLLRTEEGNIEFPVEGENWIAAAEFADSMGVDIINTSLGYSTFDEDSLNYTYANMDGKTTRVSRASAIAASKGILLATSAGNSGHTQWRHITAPADADSILAVGATYPDSLITNFSSKGPTADNRIKPDVVTLGFKPAIVTQNGTIKNVSMGTSFSSPIIAGLTACLWQEFPEATAQEIRKAVIQSSHAYYTPNESIGYGIPDFEKARKILRYSHTSNIVQHAHIYPNPFTTHLILEAAYSHQETIHFELYSQDGKCVLQQDFPLNTYMSKHETSEISLLPPGTYIAIISFGNVLHVQKVQKML